MTVLACRVRSSQYPSVRQQALNFGVECEAVDQDDRDTYFDLVGAKADALVRACVSEYLLPVFVLDHSDVIPLTRRAINA